MVFVTGIPRAGKSSSVATAVQGTAAIVFEGQLSRPVPAMHKIEQALDKGFTQQGSTSKQQDASRIAWRQDLGRKMVEASKRMETDPVYRKHVQSITR